MLRSKREELPHRKHGNIPPVTDAGSALPGSVLAGAQVRPTPSDDELAAILAAVEVAWPRPAPPTRPRSRPGGGSRAAGGPARCPPAATAPDSLALRSASFPAGASPSGCHRLSCFAPLRTRPCGRSAFARYAAGRVRRRPNYTVDETLPAFREASDWFLSVLRGIGDDQWAAAGAGGVVGAGTGGARQPGLPTVADYLGPHGEIDVDSAADYFRRAMPDAAVNAAIAERGRDEAIALAARPGRGHRGAGRPGRSP